MKDGVHPIRTNTARRIISGSVWSVLGAVLTRLLALTLSVLLVRLLGKAEYGKFVLIQSTLSTLVVFGSVGLAVSATKFSAELATNDPIRLARILTLMRRASIFFATCVAGLSAFASEYVARNFLNTADIRWPLAIGSIGVIFLSLDAFFCGVLLGFESIKRSVLGTLLAVVVAFPFQVALVWFYGLYGAVIGFVLLSVIQCGISHSIYKHVLSSAKVPYSSPGYASEAAIVGNYALPALLASGVVIPAHWACYSILMNGQDGAAEAAVLGIVMQWFQVAVFLPAVAGRIFLPVMAEQFNNQKITTVALILKSGVYANIVFALPVVALGSVFGRDILKIYGSDFSNNTFELLLALVAAALVCVQGPVGNLMIATGRIWNGFFMNLSWAIAYVGLGWLFRAEGALGILKALVFAYIIQLGWASCFSLRFALKHRRLAPKEIPPNTEPRCFET